MPGSAHKIKVCLPGYREDAENELTRLSRQFFQEMLQKLQSCQQRIKELDVRLAHINQQNGYPQIGEHT